MSSCNANTDTMMEEQQPLLTPIRPQHYDITSVPKQDDVEGSLGAAAVEPLNGSWRFRKVLARAVIVLLAVFIVAAFIKGLIDAGDVKFDFGGALKSALGGGLSGAAAMALQVVTLMPLRTVMNYQYCHGTSTTDAFKTLNADGGYPRFYQGLPAALILGPVARFGDMASNAGILALLQSNTYTRQLPALVQTMFITTTVAGFRIMITPVDTVKTTLQTQGKDGIRLLRDRVSRYGIGSLWYGGLGNAVATFVAHYPWFATFNYLDAALPWPTTLWQKLMRSAVIGFVASIISDTVSNSLRVVKTYRQVNATRIGYVDAARAVVAVDGIRGLFGRGLKMRIWVNGIQGLMFTMLWKLFMDKWNEKTA